MADIRALPAAIGEEANRACILVCYHKPAAIIQSGFLRPIHVGRAVSESAIDGMIGDDTGREYLREKQKLLRAHGDLLGAAQRRRRLLRPDALRRRLFDFSGTFGRQECRKLDRRTVERLGLDDGTIAGQLQTHDLILPHPVDVPGGETVYEQYSNACFEEDIARLRASVLDEAPSMVEDFDATFAATRAYYFNMFVMRRALFLPFADWLFSVFQRMDRLVDWENRHGYQQRVFGFLGERLLSIYIRHLQRTRSQRFQELPVVFVSGRRRNLMHALHEQRKRMVQFRLRRDGYYLRVRNFELKGGAEVK